MSDAARIMHLMRELRDTIERNRAEEEAARLLPMPEEDGLVDVDMDSYLAWAAISGSLLSVLHMRTPWHVYQAMVNPQPRSSAALRLGSVVHTAILEPDELEARYVVAPTPDPERHTTSKGLPSSNPKNTLAYQREVEELVADNPGKELVEAEHWARGLRARDAFARNKRASQLLRAKGMVEMSAVATDPETGVRVKLRPDKLVVPVGADVNLKTTDNAREDRFSRDVYRFGYYRSAALRKLALEWLGWDWRRSILVAIETEGELRPESVVVYELDEGTMDAGEQVVRAMLRVIARCIERGDWPAHGREVRSLALPPYAWARVDDEIAEWTLQGGGE